MDLSYIVISTLCLRDIEIIISLTCKKNHQQNNSHVIKYTRTVKPIRIGYTLTSLKITGSSIDFKSLSNEHINNANNTKIDNL